ncbi:MAG TPA: fused MFS/spermidine synthase [Candidatus Paceibacterota bacterium]
MGKFLKQNLLLISVFITGACVLIVEVVALRVLSPHYGNTIFSVSSVISVILAALSIGYYSGGKLADRHPSLQWFFGIILASGFAVLAFHFLGVVILPVLSASLSFTAGPLITSIILFLFPALFLGTLSPYAVKLRSLQSPIEGVGSVSGRIFFWSTLGSIAGSLLAGFVLIPQFGIDRIFIGTGAVLFLLGFISLLILGFPKKHLVQFLFAIVILALLAFFVAKESYGDVIYTKDGVYEKITIFDGLYNGRPTRFFKQDLSSSGAMFLDSIDPTDLVYEYTKYYSVYKIFKPDASNVLVIGGGAYSIPKAFLGDLPEAMVDVAEIEPSLFDLGKEYFGVKDDPRLSNYIEDGRRLLKNSNKVYDVIFSDVYYSLFSIPTHFTTKEFFTIAKEKLSEDGIFMANLIGDLSTEEESLIMALMKTFQSVFPNNYLFAIQSPFQTGAQNIIFVGYNSDKKIDLNSPEIIQNPNPNIRSLRDHLINTGNFDLSAHPILTDNFAPVEYLTAKVLKRTF